MIKSMTGFGRGELDTEAGHLTVEVRSVNGRTCNVIIKLPESLSSLESRISSYIKSRTSRGQINALFDFSRNGTFVGKRIILDRELAREYYKQLLEMKEYISLTDAISLNTIASLPGVVNMEEPKENIEEIWPLVSRVLEMAVNQLIETREIEGSAILDDISCRLDTMLQLTERISDRTPEVAEGYSRRLKQRINDLLRDQLAIDESRIAMEVAIMAERCDITEEIVRLRSHILQMSNSLKDSNGPVGRHLDFILQEINREVNTVASKASDVQISADCIQLKNETEKVREQVQNIE